VTLVSTDPFHGGQDLAVLPIDEGVLSGSTSLPGGYVSFARTLSVQFDDGASIVVAGRFGFAEDFTYRTPHVGDGDFTLAAAAVGPADSGAYAVRPGLPYATTGVDMRLPVASNLSEPADGSTGADRSTSFGWSSPVARTHLVRFQSTSGPTFDVITGDTSVTLPDLDAVGVSIPGGTEYTWRVFGLEPYADVDAVANTEDAFLSAWFYSPFHVPLRAAKLSRSSVRSFTTAP
jgi:hypothetical protein